MTVFTVSDRSIQADGVTAHGQYSAGFLDSRFSPLCRLFERGFTTKFLLKLPINRAHPGHGFNHMNRNTNGSALVGNCPRDGLANPPGGVGAKFETTTVLEFVDRPHQTCIPLLDQIQKAEATISIFFRDRNDQPEVTFGQLAFCLLVPGVDHLQFFDSCSQAVRRLLGRQQQLTKSEDPRLSFSRITTFTLVLRDFLLQSINLSTEVLKVADHRFNSLRA